MGEQIDRRRAETLNSLLAAQMFSLQRRQSQRALGNGGVGLRRSGGVTPALQAPPWSRPTSLTPLPWFPEYSRTAPHPQQPRHSLTSIDALAAKPDHLIWLATAPPREASRLHSHVVFLVGRRRLPRPPTEHLLQIPDQVFLLIAPPAQRRVQFNLNCDGLTYLWDTPPTFCCCPSSIPWCAQWIHNPWSNNLAASSLWPATSSSLR